MNKLQFALQKAEEFMRINDLTDFDTYALIKEALELSEKQHTISDKEQPAQDDIIKSLQKVAEYFYDGKVRNLAVVDACEKAINKETGKEIYKYSVLEQPAQEPVGCIEIVSNPPRHTTTASNFFKRIKLFKDINDLPVCNLYTHPAPLQNEFAKTKSWQGLSDDEIKQNAIKLGYLWTENSEISFKMDGFLELFARAIEQELKQKNGFNDVKEKNHG